MNFVKTVFCHDTNQTLIYEIIEMHLKTKLNIDIRNFPNIMDTIRKHMYNVYKEYSTGYEIKVLNLTKKEDINICVKKMNKLTLKSFLRFYLDNYYIPFTQNEISKGKINKNPEKKFCYLKRFEENNNFTDYQNNFDKKQNNMLINRCFGNNNYMMDRLQIDTDAQSSSEYNPKLLMEDINKNYGSKAFYK